MEIKLNLEQLQYLKSLDSKKKKRKFLLDCLIEDVELFNEFNELLTNQFQFDGKWVKFQKPISESEKIERCEVCEMFSKIEGSNKCESCHSCVKHFIETSPEFAKYREKPNYSTEEIELVKHNINQREVTEQGSELLKFDMLKNEGLWSDMQSILNRFVTFEDAMKLEKAVLNPLHLPAKPFGIHLRNRNIRVPYQCLCSSALFLLLYCPLV